MSNREGRYPGADIVVDNPPIGNQHTDEQSNSSDNGRVPKRILLTSILLALNLLNYMDRFTVAGTLVDIQLFYDALDSQLGLIQTVFVCTYMLAAPIFGYCGDRYDRKWLICIGLFIWIVAGLFSSVGGYFSLFLLSRACVGIGEAAYSTIAPSIIGDLFSGATRSKMLMIYFTAMPVGSGLGYIIGSSIASFSGDWRWSLRATPLFGLGLLVALLVLFEEPERGQADNTRTTTTSYKEDIESLAKIRTYISVVIGSTSVMFVTGSLSWWAPALTEHAWGMLHYTTNIPDDVKANIGRTFGVLTCLGGLLGVASGSMLARIWTLGFDINPFILLNQIIRRIRHSFPRSEMSEFDEQPVAGSQWILKFGPNYTSEPLVCAFGSLIGVPAMWLALYLFAKSMTTGWFFTFWTIVFICMNIAITTDMILSVTPPNRRATAIAIQTLVGHLFGDAASPYLIGLLSDWLHSQQAAGPSALSVDHFVTLRTALYLPNFVLILSSVFYFRAAKTIEKDQELCTILMHEMDSPSILNHPSSSASISDCG